jgi:hypothetical protein
MTKESRRAARSGQAGPGFARVLKPDIEAIIEEGTNVHTAGCEAMFTNRLMTRELCVFAERHDVCIRVQRRLGFDPSEEHDVAPDLPEHAWFGRCGHVDRGQRSLYP